MHARAIFVHSLFAVSRIYSRFGRAIARFQRKSYRQCPSIYPENLMGKHLAFSFDSFSDSQEFLLSVDLSVLSGV